MTVPLETQSWLESGAGVAPFLRPEKRAAISLIIPTFEREQILVDTLRQLLPLLAPGDEIILVDQTPRHAAATEAALRDLARAGRIRWFRRSKPSQCEAMNLAAHLAQGEILLFLDDDIAPGPDLLEAHRRVLSSDNPPPATCGQVLQPWNAAPVETVADYGLGFNAAYNRPCEILSLMAGNFAMRREVFFQVGGMDENFVGSNYRNDAEMSHRIHRLTGRKVRFVPEAGLRHLYWGGGNRAFGAKDSWGHIGGSVGDYYFAIRCLPWGPRLQHCAARLLRAPLNRNTIRRPWLIPSLLVRELVALSWAAARVWRRPHNHIKDRNYYEVLEVQIF